MSRVLAGHSFQPGLLILPDCADCAQLRRQVEFQPLSGHGMCSCAAFSEHCVSEAARRRWHTRHKAEVLIEQGKRSK